MSGGMIPCTDAILMLGFAVGNGRLWLGLPLLLAFSAGLAAVLILVGIGVVYARRYAGRWGQGGRWQAVARALPIISAVLITVLGLWMCSASVHGH
jgi:ABC-type nickel/cobalt efflux system permease component RcnA